MGWTPPPNGPIVPTQSNGPEGQPRRRGSHEWYPNRCRSRQVGLRDRGVTYPGPRAGAAASRYPDGNKTDRTDAKALLEVVRNEALAPLPVKSLEQHAVGALHWVRQGYLQTRTARINAVRGHLREFGCVIPFGPRHVLPEAYAALESGAIPRLLRPALTTVLDEIGALRPRPTRCEMSSPSSPSRCPRPSCS
jgi:hypothetical protein